MWCCIIYYLFHCLVIYSPGNRPDPEGVSSVDLYSSPNVINSFDLPPLSSPVIIDEEEDPTAVVKEGLLSVLNEMHLNVSWNSHCS